eukprot:m.681718 g.681718  ORF g.681718 m.681718 type:complete len:59 (+) comp22813_c0_seq4:3079-3255(+)
MNGRVRYTLGTAGAPEEPCIHLWQTQWSHTTRDILPPLGIVVQMFADTILVPASLIVE